MHIFLTGDVQVGKSTIIRKTLLALQLQAIGGFRSISVPDLPDGINFNIIIFTLIFL